ncbi:MAG: phosphotransferase enzyme family protein [Desulfobaccales bacterium]
MRLIGKPSPLSLWGGGILEPLVAIAQQFTPVGRVREVRRHGCGNVNDTFLVTLEDPPGSRFILQRLNTAVFRRPDLVMGNLETVTRHARRRLAKEPLEARRRFELPQALLTGEGQNHVINDQGRFWRALTFIEGALTYDTVQNTDHAFEVGYALGLFHRLLADLPPHLLADTLPGFHLTPAYLEYFDQILAAHGAPSSAEVTYCLRFIDRRRSFVPVLEEAKKQGRLKPRIIHGDPKVNNVMVDAVSRQAVGLIDLDTVKPGLVHYDLGDCLRSGCNLLGEETEAWKAVRFDPGICRAILAGYLHEARSFLTPNDQAYLYDAVRLLTFELGLRFFADYLAGNVYFRTSDQDHNLRRALVQFRLTESIEAQASDIQGLIRELL